MISIIVIIITIISIIVIISIVVIIIIIIITIIIIIIIIILLLVLLLSSSSLLLVLLLVLLLLLHYCYYYYCYDVLFVCSCFPGSGAGPAGGRVRPGAAAGVWPGLPEGKAGLRQRRAQQARLGGRTARLLRALPAARRGVPRSPGAVHYYYYYYYY